MIAMLIFTAVAQVAIAGMVVTTGVINYKTMRRQRAIRDAFERWQLLVNTNIEELHRRIELLEAVAEARR